ncbi:MAG: nucleotide exchange factor GrpE [Planctomycetia bacterium]|nr:nucleotide exchange factor GrpE [Planctomycetia bacterium]
MMEKKMTHPNRNPNPNPQNDDPQAADEPVEMEAFEEMEGTEEAENPLLFELQKLEADLAQEHDRALRIQAEYENFRRRTARELDDEHKYAGMELLRDILPVMDNLQRAIEAAEKQDADDPLLEGVRMVFEQMKTALEKNHCVRIDALHQPFDPNFHQAISQMPSEEFDNGTVLIVAQEGYLLSDRVVRPSQVIVCKK